MLVFDRANSDKLLILLDRFVYAVLATVLAAERWRLGTCHYKFYILWLVNKSINISSIVHYTDLLQSPVVLWGSD